MVKKWKEVIRPGTYVYEDAQKRPRRLVVTPEDVDHYYQTGCGMIAANLAIPVPVEHQGDAQPVSASEANADRLKNNAGWIRKFAVKGGVLFALADITDPRVAQQITDGSVVDTSPQIEPSFVDGKGRQWERAVTHLALTLRPRITEQRTFSADPPKGWDGAALMSLSDLKEVVRPADSCFTRSEGGKLVLQDPARFALFGYAVAVKPVAQAKKASAFAWFSMTKAGKKIWLAQPSDKVDPDKARAVLKDGTVNGEPLTKAQRGMFGAAAGKDSAKMAVDLNPVTPAADVAVPTDSQPMDDMQALTAALACYGIQMPEDTNKDNVREKLKMALGDDTPEPPLPGGEGIDDALEPAADVTPAMEQQPMYMSLQSIAKQNDPVKLALATRILNDAAAGRKKRIDALVARKGQAEQKPYRDDLEALAQTAQLSLCVDGTVRDSFEPILLSHEKHIPDTRQRLAGRVQGGQTAPADVVALAHPSQSGQVDKTKAAEIAARLRAKQGNVPVAKRA